MGGGGGGVVGQGVRCNMPDALDATLQHVSCNMPAALDATLQRSSKYLIPCQRLFCFYVQVSQVKPVMLTFKSSEFHTNWFALHRIHDSFVALTTWAPKGRGCSHVIHDSSHCL